MDIEKAMEFLLEQQAATAAQLQQTGAKIERLEAVVEQHHADLQTHTEWLQGLTESMTSLADTMKAGFAELASKQKTTEGNLNILIQTVQDILPRLPKQ